MANIWDGLTSGHVIIKGHLIIVHNWYSIACSIFLIHFSAFIILENGMQCILWLLHLVWEQIIGFFNFQGMDSVEREKNLEREPLFL